MRSKLHGLVKIILVLAFLLLSVYYVLDESLLANKIMRESVESPDNKYIAYLFVSSPATVRDTYHLSILKKGENFNTNRGNVFRSEKSFVAEWVKPDELNISRYEKGFKEVTYFEGIKITYSEEHSEAPLQLFKLPPYKSLTN
ncbi:hypothetical protein LJC10_05900 [Selenomonadales bacterium OttesenSCG-928-I06]|nr:hypothetical protein [Selenomonadales bacterium OttesenSCG-928-I06]